MAFHVRLSPRAAADAEQIYRHVAGAGSEAGHRWYRGLITALYSLESLPARCEIVPGLSMPLCTVRKLLHGRKPHVYKIYFAIGEDTVQILHIRHGARREPKVADLA